MFTLIFFFTSFAAYDFTAESPIVYFFFSFIPPDDCPMLPNHV